MKEKLGECEEMITDLEKRLRERNDAWQNDRLKYSNEIKRLRNEVSIRFLSSAKVLGGIFIFTTPEDWRTSYKLKLEKGSVFECT